MKRNRKFDSGIRFLFSLVFWIFVASGAARAESVHGKFFNGQTYEGDYSVTEGSNSDGMRVNPLTIKLRVDGGKSPLIYTYVADDLPSVKASDMGFLSVVVNSGGMEGSVTYNYVIPDRGALVSIGIVQTTLHLGKVESIDVQPNSRLTKKEVNEFIEGIVRFNLPALSAPLNAYSISILLLLGRGDFLTPEDNSRLSAIYMSKEISNDPVLLRAIEKIIGPGIQSGSDARGVNDRVIVNNRAYFFNSPEGAGVEKSYLIKGDVVSLVKKSNDGRYWLADYVSPRGKKVEKWLRCEDVDYCR
ncbi:hypothetical protein LMG28688_04266 [Paraburkholderia caffeinitolerans]|uniref:Uncharacterized protein n=1 Tax=Paraburkholderia caffeinitolerans TaxID=1723730 RepID=A0A6J5G9U3_9BURK|nr:MULTISPECIES: hypothetical protein [Paraburkholderia]CAB3796243.1 hypothetical protein LMG28688_04266 [Paraburkholderia caffeinitolerans]